MFDQLNFPHPTFDLFQEPIRRFSKMHLNDLFVQKQRISSQSYIRHPHSASSVDLGREIFRRNSMPNQCGLIQSVDFPSGLHVCSRGWTRIVLKALSGCDSQWAPGFYRSSVHSSPPPFFGQLQDEQDKKVTCYLFCDYSS